MALSDLRTNHLTNNVFNTTKFGETIIRNIGGDQGNTASLTGLVSWNPDDLIPEGRIRRGRVKLPDSATVTIADSLVIGGNITEVTAVSPDHIGTFFVDVVQRIPERKGYRKLRTGDL